MENKKVDMKIGYQTALTLLQGDNFFNACRIGELFF